MSWVFWATGLILTLATWGTVYRIWKGPALLDRVLASDALLSILTAALCVLMILTDSQFYMILLVTIAMIGFVGSVTVARFADNSKADETAPVSKIVAPGRVKAKRQRLTRSRRRPPVSAQGAVKTEEGRA